MAYSNPDYPHRLLAVFGKDTTLLTYEKKIKEMERLLGRKEVELALLQSFMDGSS